MVKLTRRQFIEEMNFKGLQLFQSIFTSDFDIDFDELKLSISREVESVEIKSNAIIINGSYCSFYSGDEFYKTKGNRLIKMNRKQENVIIYENKEIKK